MLKQIARTLAIAATFFALVTPAALASTPLGTDPEPGVTQPALASTPLGTDPEPGAMQAVLVYFGLA